MLIHKNKGFTTVTKKTLSAHYVDRERCLDRGADMSKAIQTPIKTLNSNAGFTTTGFTAQDQSSGIIDSININCSLREYKHEQLQHACVKKWKKKKNKQNHKCR